jgi:type IV secretory pathway TraG/TraD family ATPase VirD4
MRSAFARSKTLHHGSDSTSEGLAERPISLLSAQAITQMKDNEILGFHRHYPPFRAKRMDWRQFQILTQRQKLPPPSLPALPPLQSPPATAWQKSQGVRTYIDPDKFN